MLCIRVSLNILCSCSAVLISKGKKRREQLVVLVNVITIPALIFACSAYEGAGGVAVEFKITINTECK